jgi:hypothetical protein
VIQAPEKHRSFYLESKIYFFNTPVHLTIKVSTKNLTIDVIRHIMTVYKHSTFAETKPLKYPDDPERYQLWLIDEYESAYAPDEEMGARPLNSEIGQFETLAFMETKNFKKGAKESGKEQMEEM